MSLLSFDKSKQRIAEAAKHIPGGVNSNFRYGIAPTPLVFERGAGPYLYDIDGNQLIDYYLGMGPMILGHNPDVVVKAVEAQIKNGILYAGQSEIEFKAAELICKTVPCAERVRFGSSGSEVVQAALRLSRAATGRMKIIKFEGHYHGWMDNILWSTGPTLEQAGPADSPQRVAGSPGQDALAGENLEVLPWNNLDLLKARLDKRDVAAIIMEPAMCNTSAIIPDDGYLAGVRAACTATGTILIFDEVITGFRVAPGGAQQRLGITPDLSTFGKAIANGFSVAALAGRADLMDLFVTQKVLHGGSYNAQPLCMAAVYATVSTLSQPGFFDVLEKSGKRLMDGIAGALAGADIPARVQGFPEIFHVALGVSGPIRNYRDAIKADRAKYVQLTTQMLYRGVRALERGAWFISSAHTDDVIDQTIAAVGDAARALR